MKNFKTIALGLLVGALAIGFSSFTTKKHFSSVTYYQTSANNYEKLADPEGICDPDLSADHGCFITYPSDPGVPSFSYSARPAGGTESSDDVLYSE